MYQLIILLGVIFFFIDLTCYKPPNFGKYTISTILLLCHHFFGVYVILGGILACVNPILNQHYFILLILMIVHWQILDNKCVLSILTHTFGPKEYKYVPFVGPLDLINTNNINKALQTYYEFKNY